MQKEVELLKRLKEAKADIGLILIKDMLDTQFTLENDGEYARPYTEAEEEIKWLFAKKFKENLSRNIFFWSSYIESMDFQETYEEFFGAD